MAWKALLYQAAFVVSICFCVYKFRFVPALLNRDIGQICLNAKKVEPALAHKRFVAQLVQDMKICILNDGSVCCQSKSYIEIDGKSRYENCHANGLAIFLRT